VVRAAIGRVQTKLADFANVSLAGSMSTPGFGSVEKKVGERQKETIQNVDASASVELGEFLGEKSGMRVPMYVGFSQSVSKPQYDPFNEDIELNNTLSDASPTYADSVKDMAKNLTIRRSINFTNVRKEKGKNAGKATHI